MKSVIDAKKQGSALSIVEQHFLFSFAAAWLVNINGCILLVVMYSKIDRKQWLHNLNLCLDLLK